MENNSNKVFWWLDFASHLLDWKTPRGFAGVLLLFVPLYAGVWTIRESSGTTGSIAVVLEILATSAAILGASLLGAKLLRWPLLYRAVFKYTEVLLKQKIITENTVLVGEGPGGALAVGMVSKAIQELGYRVPLSIVLDCEFIDNPKPKVGVLLPHNYRIPRDEILIVGSYAGTGASIQALKERLKLENTKVFCFIVGETLMRGYVDYYLYSGSRAVLPWPQTTHHSRQKNLSVENKKTNKLSIQGKAPRTKKILGTDSNSGK